VERCHFIEHFKIDLSDIGAFNQIQKREREREREREKIRNIFDTF